MSAEADAMTDAALRAAACTGDGVDDGLVPLPRHVVNAWKKEKARELLAGGTPKGEVAKLLGISRDTLWRWENHHA